MSRDPKSLHDRNDDLLTRVNALLLQAKEVAKGIESLIDELPPGGNDGKR